MTHSERLDQINQAMDLIVEARDLVDDAVQGTQNEAHYRAYGKYGFNTLLGDGNPYDSSLHTLVEYFES